METAALVVLTVTAALQTTLAVPGKSRAAAAPRCSYDLCMLSCMGGYKKDENGCYICVCKEVDGNWSPWTAWGECTETCGGGQQARSRECTDPAPAHGGKGCDGGTHETQACNEKSCPARHDKSARRDLWTRSPTGCQCYWDHRRRDCACCEDGGCQCTHDNPHQCVRCGYGADCGRHIYAPEDGVDGWTKTMTGCACPGGEGRQCACCQNGGCPCGEGRQKSQCVLCGSEDKHCGNKPHIFG